MQQLLVLKPELREGEVKWVAHQYRAPNSSTPSSITLAE